MGSKYKYWLDPIRYLRDLDPNRLVCMNQVNSDIGPQKIGPQRFCIKGSH